MQLPIDEKYTHSKGFLKNSLCILFGGRIAEKIIFNEITTGAGNDLERATALARKMVCEWGMSDELGPLTYGKKEEQIFLGREIAQHRDFSEETARQIDLAVKEIILEASNKVTDMLKDSRNILKRMADDLLEKETIVLEDIEQMIKELRPEAYEARQSQKKRPAQAKSKDTKPESPADEPPEPKKKDSQVDETQQSPEPDTAAEENDPPSA
jgi:cell division protease FtsH